MNNALGELPSRKAFCFSSLNNLSALTSVRNCLDRSRSPYWLVDDFVGMMFEKEGKITPHLKGGYPPPRNRYMPVIAPHA